jgi:hypothetical protein
VQNTFCTQWGSPKKGKQKTLDLNPSPVAWSKLCKEMGEKPGRTPSLEEASPAATTAQHKIVRKQDQFFPALLFFGAFLGYIYKRKIIQCTL